jgi:poly(3-hydroxybutyrate) depolymerase
MARFLVVDDSAELAVWLAAALAGVACTGKSETVEPAGSMTTSEPVAVELAGLALTPGPAEATVSVEGQGARDIAVWMPEGPGPHPLAVFLHGGGGGDGLIDGLLGCLVEPALAPSSPIIVAPRNARGQWWLESEAAFVLGLVEAAQTTWSIEPSRSVLLGYSNGGIGTWFFARQRPDLFGAAIPMAASVSFIGPTPLPVYAIAGEEDELFAFDEVSRAIEELIADGQDVTFDAKAGGSHFEACDYVPELEAAREWLTGSVWD